MNKGLRPKTQDTRDIKTGQILNLPELKDIPNKLVLGTPIVKNQHDTDYCGAFAGTSSSELQEGIELSPEWQFAVIKDMEGDVSSWGTELRDVCKSMVKKGSLPKARAPYSLDNQPNSFLRDIKNWDIKLFADAFMFRKETYLSVEGQYDSFDDIRAFMTYFNNRGQKNAVIFGVEWGWSLRDVKIDTIPESGFGHALCAFGFDGDYLIVLNSAGEEAGDKGVHYIHRTVINHFVKKYGAYTLVDIPRDTAEYHATTGTKLTDNPWKLLFSNIIQIWNFLKDFFLFFNR